MKAICIDDRTVENDVTKDKMYDIEEVRGDPEYVNIVKNDRGSGSSLYKKRFSFFEIGKKVKKRNGETFSNGKFEMTISKIEEEPNCYSRVWLKESDTHINISDVILVENQPPTLVTEEDEDSEDDGEWVKAVCLDAGTNPITDGNIYDIKIVTERGETWALIKNNDRGEECRCYLTRFKVLDSNGRIDYNDMYPKTIISKNDEVKKMEIKDIKQENLKEAQQQVMTEKQNEEIRFAKTQLQMAINKIDEYDREIKKFETWKLPYQAIIDQFPKQKK